MCLLSILCCPLQLALGQQGTVLTKVEEIFFLHFLMETRDAFWRKNPKTFLRKYLLPIPTGGQIPVLPKISEIFILTLATGHEKCGWSPILKIYFLYYPLRMRCSFWKNPKTFSNFLFSLHHRGNRNRLAEKTEKIFSVLSPIHLDRNAYFGRKKSKKISPPTEKFCEKAYRRAY